MDLGLVDKTALVTGASIGLGRGIAELLAEEGCRLALLARRRPLLEEVADGIAAGGRPRPVIIEQDLLADGAEDRIARQVADQLGPLDILINNAGASHPMDGLGSDGEWLRSMDLNFHVYRRLAHTFVGGMQARGFGRIVNITGPDEPTILNSAMPPNGAVHIWAKALSRLVARDGVTINSIPPGRIHSEQIDTRILPTEEARKAWVDQHCPAGYIGEPEDLAVLAVFLCSPRARYITGQVIHCDGGVRHVAA